MRLQGRGGADAGVEGKVRGSLLLVAVSAATGVTLHPMILDLSGQRDDFFELFEHFHDPDPQDD